MNCDGKGEAVDVRDFGAQGNYEVDDTRAFQEAINFACGHAAAT